jgi:hypothetical protein
VVIRVSVNLSGAADTADEMKIKNKTSPIETKATECNFSLAFIYPTPTLSFIFHITKVNNIRQILIINYLLLNIKNRKIV